MSMWTGRFWAAAVERAVKTAAQSALALIVVDVSLLDTDWLSILAVSGTAAVASLLTSVVSSQAGPDGGPSLSGEVLTRAPRVEG